MSLSKVYSTGDAFEPEELIAQKLDEQAVFGSIIVERIPAETIDAEQERPTPGSANGDMAQDSQNNSPDSSPEALPEIEPEIFPGNGLELLDETPQVESAGGPDVPSPATSRQPPQQPPPLEPETEESHNPQEVPPATPQSPQAGSTIPVEEVQQLLAESYENGVSDGLKQAEQDFGATATTMLQICQQLDTIRETILRNSVGEMQDLVLAIAEKIVRRSVAEQQETVLRTVEEAIGKAVKSDELFIYVNPDDFGKVEEKVPDLMQGLSGLSNLIVKKDPHIERGGCRVESESCTVDATIISQLELIDEQLTRQK